MIILKIFSLLSELREIQLFVMNVVVDLSDHLVNLAKPRSHIKRFLS